MFVNWYFGEQLPTWAIFTELSVCGLLVILLGSYLTHLADRLSDQLGLGKMWIGLLLLATITSLPELATGATAVLLGEPDLAFGNIFGSCMFNVAIIVLINGVMRRGSVLGGANLGHSLTASMGVVLMVLCLLGFTLIERLADAPAPQWMTPAFMESAVCIVIAASYIVCMRLSYRFERKQQVEGQMTLEAVVDDGANPRLYTKFGVVALLLIGVTIWLTKTGDVLQAHPIEALGGMTLGGTFVGAFFLAVATSLPEIATSITAVRLGHLDLALGNIFGSNMFNIFVVPILKVFSLAKGEKLLMSGSHFSPLSHSVTGLFAILITGVAVAGLTYRTQKRLFGFGFDSILIGLIYIIGMYIILRI